MNVVAAGGLTLIFDLTAGEFLSSTGFSRLQALGSLDPDLNFFQFGTFDQIVDVDNFGIRFIINDPAIPDTDETFRWFSIEGVFLGGQARHVYFRKDRTTYDGTLSANTQTLWEWDPPVDVMVDTNVYKMQVHR